MLRINRLRIEIFTEQGLYGFDETFSSGLNFIASNNNTNGKSSIIEAVFYALGFEEIIGGKGEKVLTSVYKNVLEDTDKKQNLSVSSSKVYLEISNGQEVVTSLRTVRDKRRDSRLITVYYGSIDNINSGLLSEDKFVHLSGSATDEAGFHTFLEHFLNVSLPVVPSTDGKERKLYLQLIFASMFIEQKHGWLDILSGIPLLGIRDSRKRVIEFVLDLDTLRNEKKKEELNQRVRQIQDEWEYVVKEIYNSVNREACTITGLSFRPFEISTVDIAGIQILKEGKELSGVIEEIDKEIESLNAMTPKVIDNYDEMQQELSEVEREIKELEIMQAEIRQQNVNEKFSIRALTSNIATIQEDIQNNKDAAKLRELGSKLNIKSFSSTCPICGQRIQDTLLLQQDVKVMSIDENIRHLEAQKNMFEFSLDSHKSNLYETEKDLTEVQASIFTLRRLALLLRNDLFSVRDSDSQSIIYKKVDCEGKRLTYTKLLELINEQKKKLLSLGKKWGELQKEKNALPKRAFSDMDTKKVAYLRKSFVNNLVSFGYKSAYDVSKIHISEDTLMPVIESFDMKFDSSASDNIRAIWAFTIALMETSMCYGGNHPTHLIFDEPAQHSIIPEDLKVFIQKLVSLKGNAQFLVGLTVKDELTKRIIDDLKEHIIT